MLVNTTSLTFYVSGGERRERNIINISEVQSEVGEYHIVILFPDILFG
jgi:hypothetical protein